MLLKAGVVLMTLALAFTAVVSLVAAYDEPMEHAVAQKKPEPKPSVEPLVRKYPPLPKQKVKAAEPQPKPEPAEPASKPTAQPEPQQQVLPVAKQNWPMPSEEEISTASQPRHYNLPSGAVMGLTIPAIGLYDVPVYDSASQWALDNGISHIPETSLPWSPTPQRNVYLAGHRLGWPGTWSHLVFYNLDKLGAGDSIILKDRQGHSYEYKVTESFVTDPTDSWVMGQVVGRDMVTLQTCTPIPTFNKRLVVRADRVSG
jgi:sortase A